MLGELIYEARGKVTGVRMLPGGKFEPSFQDSGKLLGMDVTNMGTYTAEVQPTGMIYGEGQGVVMSKDGEMVSWTANGLGKPGRGMAASYRGAIYFKTASQKLARLNTTAGVFEYEIDENGNNLGKVWEWK